MALMTSFQLTCRRHRRFHRHSRHIPSVDFAYGVCQTNGTLHTTTTASGEANDLLSIRQAFRPRYRQKENQQPIHGPAPSVTSLHKPIQ